MYLLTYFWMHGVLGATHRLSLVVASGGHAPAVMVGLHCGSGGALELRLGSCGTWAQLPWACGILVPGRRMEPVSPALACGFLAIGLPGKSSITYFKTATSAVKKLEQHYPTEFSKTMESFYSPGSHQQSCHSWASESG